MKRTKKIGLFVAMSLTTVSALIFSGCSITNKTQEISNNMDKAKNVIVFVGDGMGAAARQAIKLATVGTNRELAMNDMPYSGVVHTSSTSIVTDSAAAATAFATGAKTYNGAIGVDANKQPVETVLETAKKAGKSTGMVTTSQITDATPAAFGAHIANRTSQSDIAKQFLENSKVDVMLGGGEDYWYPAGQPGAYPDHPPEDPKEVSKGTNGNLVEEARKLGYNYVTDADEMKNASGDKILGLFANEEMFQQNVEGEGDIYSPVVSLPDMTQKVLDTLSKNNDGFFLMVEEEAIDEMAHKNNATQTIKAGQQLDKAVTIAKEFAKWHPDTLVLVFGDHETGGLAVEDISNSDESTDGKTISGEDGPFNVANSNQKFMVDWTVSGHTAADIPLTAMGPGAQLFSGVYENTHIHDAIIKAMGLGEKE